MDRDRSSSFIMFYPPSCLTGLANHGLQDSIQKLNYNANLCGLLLPGAPLADALYADIGESSASAAKWDPMTRAAPNPKADISRAAKDGGNAGNEDFEVF